MKWFERSNFCTNSFIKKTSQNASLATAARELIEDLFQKAADAASINNLRSSPSMQTQACQGEEILIAVGEVVDELFQRASSEVTCYKSSENDESKGESVLPKELSIAQDNEWINNNQNATLEKTPCATQLQGDYAVDFDIENKIPISSSNSKGVWNVYEEISQMEVCSVVMESDRRMDDKVDGLKDLKPGTNKEQNSDQKVTKIPEYPNTISRDEGEDAVPGNCNSLKEHLDTEAENGRFTEQDRASVIFCSGPAEVEDCSSLDCAVIGLEGPPNKIPKLDVHYSTCFIPTQHVTNSETVTIGENCADLKDKTFRTAVQLSGAKYEILVSDDHNAEKMPQSVCSAKEFPTFITGDEMTAVKTISRGDYGNDKAKEESYKEVEEEKKKVEMDFKASAKKITNNEEYYHIGEQSQVPPGESYILKSSANSIDASTLPRQHIYLEDICLDASDATNQETSVRKIEEETQDDQDALTGGCQVDTDVQKKDNIPDGCHDVADVANQEINVRGIEEEPPQMMVAQDVLIKDCQIDVNEKHENIFEDHIDGCCDATDAANQENSVIGIKQEPLPHIIDDDALTANCQFSVSEQEKTSFQDGYQTNCTGVDEKETLQQAAVQDVQNHQIDGRRQTEHHFPGEEIALIQSPLEQKVTQDALRGGHIDADTLNKNCVQVEKIQPIQTPLKQTFAQDTSGGYRQNDLENQNESSFHGGEIQPSPSPLQHEVLQAALMGDCQIESGREQESSFSCKELLQPIHDQRVPSLLEEEEDCVHGDRSHGLYASDEDDEAYLIVKRRRDDIVGPMPDSHPSESKDQEHRAPEAPGNCEDRCFTGLSQAPSGNQLVPQNPSQIFRWRHKISYDSQMPQINSTLPSAVLKDTHKVPDCQWRPLPLPPCSRKRRIGLSRRQRINPLHGLHSPPCQQRQTDPTKKHEE